MPPARQRTFLGSGDLPPEGRSDETIVPLQGELSRFQPVAKLAEGLSPVADRCLLSAVDFRKGAAVRRVGKDGGVADSLRPPPRRRPPPPDGAPRLRPAAAPLPQAPG